MESENSLINKLSWHGSSLESSGFKVELYKLCLFLILFYLGTWKHRNFRKYLLSHDDQYNTPFHYAAMNCHNEMLGYLLETFKVKIDELGQNRMSALHFAARYGYEDKADTVSIYKIFEVSNISLLDRILKLTKHGKQLNFCFKKGKDVFES